jgi:hypothetical protein
MPASEQLAARIRGLPDGRCRAVLYLTATEGEGAAAAVGDSIDMLSDGTPLEGPAARAADLADRLTRHEICGSPGCPRCSRVLNEAVAFLRDLAGQCPACGGLLPGHALTCPRHVTQAVTE